uniref:Uncharacterized protein n=1 Tax=Fagus sylvatica TaxID=28930 RepID=A0A2N9GSK8_FAGSY
MSFAKLSVTVSQSQLFGTKSFWGFLLPAWWFGGGLGLPAWSFGFSVEARNRLIRWWLGDLG